MTAEQRSAVQGLIVLATAGKYSLGMDLPQHWRRWNFIGITESYAACVFTIEGAPGSDPRAIERLYEVYRDYMTYGNTAQGVGTEGIGYHTGGVGHLIGPMIAFANRGRNLLVHPHLRAVTESWLVQALQPFGGAFQSGGDLGNFPPNPWLVQPMKHFYPTSPKVDLVYRNHPQVRDQDWDKIILEGSEPMLFCIEDPAPQDTRAAATAGLGLTFHDAERGVLHTRTGWGSDDARLHVECRVDTLFPSHDHPDRGSFTFSALGRAWACDGFRDTEGKYHNLVTIDGRGQAYFPSPGRWVSLVDNAQATFAVTDAKYAWDWKWAKSTYLKSRASLEGRNQGVFAEAAERLQSRFPLSEWELDPSPAVWAYNEGFTTVGDPRMWNNEDGWVPRTSWYPVQKAFRTTGLVRGPQPYVLIIDDLKKDDQERLYEWRMNGGPDIEAVSIDGNDILLGDQTTARRPVVLDRAFQGRTALAPKKGDRLLLVRTLDRGEPELSTLQAIPMVATIEYKKTDDSHQFSGRSLGHGTQVVIPASQHRGRSQGPAGPPPVRRCPAHDHLERRPHGADHRLEGPGRRVPLPHHARGLHGLHCHPQRQAPGGGALLSAPSYRALLDGPEPAKIAVGSATLWHQPSVSVTSPVPALVWIHGGAWRGGDANVFWPHARYFAQRGLASFSIGYRKVAPGGPTIQDALADTRAAVTHLLTQAAIYGVDPTRVVVAGDSAGGHLTACLSALADLPIPLAAQVLGNPVIDTTEDPWPATGGAPCCPRANPPPWRPRPSVPPPWPGRPCTRCARASRRPSCCTATSTPSCPCTTPNATPPACAPSAPT